MRMAFSTIHAPSTMRMTGQNWPQSISGRSSPRVLVAKNHNPTMRTIAPTISETLRPLSDAGGRHVDDGGAGGGSVRGGGGAPTGPPLAWTSPGVGASVGVPVEDAPVGGGAPVDGAVGVRVVSASVTW